MSAVTMSLPVETVIQLTGYCLGIGGSIAVGNMLGKRDKESASRLFSVTFLVTFIVGILFSLCAFPAAGPIARLLVPGGGDLTNYTRDYIRISMLGAPIIGIGLMMVNYLGVENHPELVFAVSYLIMPVMEKWKFVYNKLCYYSKQISKMYAVHIGVYFVVGGFSAFYEFNVKECLLWSVAVLIATDLLVQGYVIAVDKMKSNKASGKALQ